MINNLFHGLMFYLVKKILLIFTTTGSYLKQLSSIKDKLFIKALILRNLHHLVDLLSHCGTPIPVSDTVDLG